MRASQFLAILFVFLMTTNSLTAAPSTTFELLDGDRVILLGNTFIERAQRYGHIEAAMTCRYPDRNITFRNLGWSGDTVWAESRGIFDNAAKGYQRMIEQVKGLKPTVIILGYGGNEAYAGEAGLERFVKQYNKLMDDLKKASGEKVRFVIVTPTRHEKAGPPLPDPEPINAKLSIYRDALSKIAEDRKCAFVDLFGQFRRPIPLTDNGIHLTENGYRVLSGTFVGFMKSTSRTGFWVGIDFKKQASRQHDTEIKDLKLNGDECQFKVVDPTKGDANGPWRFLRVYGLPDGRYTLKIDGRDNVTHTAAAWAKGTTISIPAAQRRYDQLRQTIVEKNELYFYQWRPQNVTYLLLFRKHEQGNNAVEIPQFNPLIAAKEKEVAKLREPVTRTFEIVKAKGGAK